MNEAVGDFVYVDPIEQDGNQWTGHVVSRGWKVGRYSTVYDCDLVTYNDADIVRTLVYEGDTVHQLWIQNITKIEGVY